MDLLEYQAKELFRQMGIPVLPSQRIDHPRELKGLKIPYPVVLKSQVHSGGRAKMGGIRFVENTIDAVAAAQAIFRLPILGQYPDVVLAEAKYQPERELYLAIVLDRASRRPLLLGSQQGGIEVESAAQQTQQVVVDQEFSPFYARRLAILMGLQGELIQSVSAILEKMFWLFLRKDLDLVEINPLAVSSTGELMALDGKVAVNDHALRRHGELASLRTDAYEHAENGRSVGSIELVRLSGNIGILCNGAGLTMTTMDLLSKAGGKVAGFLNLGGEFRYDLPPAMLRERIEHGLDLITEDRGIKAILINIFGNVVPCDEIAETIALFVHRRSRNSHTLPPLVLRLVGRHLEDAKAHLTKVNLSVFESLDDAISKTVLLSRSRVG